MVETVTTGDMAAIERLDATVTGAAAAVVVVVVVPVAVAVAIDRGLGPGLAEASAARALLASRANRSVSTLLSVSAIALGLVIADVWVMDDISAVRDWRDGIIDSPPTGLVSAPLAC